MKPNKQTHPKAYGDWVGSQLKNWDPADDRGGPTIYVPRFNGVQALDVEGVDEYQGDEHEETP